MKVLSAAAAALRDHGIDTMFGVMGDANMYLVDRFVRDHGGRFFSTAHEAGGVMMAAGYAAVTGRPAAATATHGAVTNMVSALFDATRGGYPLVVILGDTGARDGYHLQNLPHKEIVAPTGARFIDVRSASTVVEDIARAVRWAQTESRPVVVNLPIDIQNEDVDYTKVSWGALPSRVWGPEPSAVEDAVGLISAARRPVVIGGRGAADPAAREAVARLAERIGAPVASTLRGKDLFRGDPFNLGICGGLATPLGTEIIANADTLIAFGASLSALTADYGDLIAGKRI
ncbi:MAG TPA: thiamine pyrophosphate-binding protein, partial [Actinomycetes bacterium]|nr:thiamine pyrophosphate-binding protein [Actinomycetes bacterium]